MKAATKAEDATAITQLTIVHEEQLKDQHIFEQILQKKMTEEISSLKKTIGKLEGLVKDRTDRFTASQGKLKAAKKCQRTEYKGKASNVTGEKETAVKDLKAKISKVTGEKDTLLKNLKMKTNEMVASMREEG